MIREVGHYAAHARGRLLPLMEDEPCRWLWRQLRRSFPVVLSVTLMPDHPHMIAPAGREETFRRILAAFSRRFGWGQLWEKVERAVPLTTPDKRRRGVRYTALNPNRPTWMNGGWVKLAEDPLGWRWSTHRDVLGCAADPWVTAEQMRCEFRWPREGFEERFHRYVSSDPHVAVEGTPLPELALPSAVPRGSLEAVCDAVLEATRQPAEALRRKTLARRLFVNLAHRQGWRSATELGRICGVHPNSITRLASQPVPPGALHAAVSCLGDPRLRPRRNDCCANVQVA